MPPGQPFTKRTGECYQFETSKTVSFYLYFSRTEGKTVFAAVNPIYDSTPLSGTYCMR